jgi:hypothetical protein
MRRRVARRIRDRRAQNGLTLVVPAELPVEVGQVDGRRGELRAEPQRCLVFGLGLNGLSGVCTENLIRVDDVKKSPNLAE